MSKLPEMQAISYLLSLKLGALMGFVREVGRSWFPGRQPERPEFEGPDPLLLVALADVEAAAGRHREAKCLVEAAYIAFDRHS